AAYVGMGQARPAPGPIKLLQHPDEPAPLIMPAPVSAAGKGNGHGNGHDSSGNGHGAGETPYQMWKRTNVVPQKQPGYAAAVVKLQMGDLTAQQMLFIADLA